MHIDSYTENQLVKELIDVDKLNVRDRYRIYSLVNRKVKLL